jgi:hypothetical protein
MVDVIWHDGAQRDSGMMDGERDRLGERREVSDNFNDDQEKDVRGQDWRELRPSLPPANEDADLGSALRRIYQETVKEDIPDEMLDLLRRLT